jgi:hypothetical protein
MGSVWLGRVAEIVDPFSLLTPLPRNAQDLKSQLFPYTPGSKLTSRALCIRAVTAYASQLVQSTPGRNARLRMKNTAPGTWITIVPIESAPTSRVV